MPVRKPSLAQVLALVRHVRDSHWAQRTRDRLIEQFGLHTYNHAVRAGYIEQAVRYRVRTDFIDLTPEGLRYLKRMAATGRGEI